MKIYIIFLLFLGNVSLFAQNLVINPNFESENICHKYEELCSPVGWRALNLKSFGYKESEIGGKYISLLLFDVARKNDRRFAQSELICPLIKGEKYTIKFKVKRDHFWINAVTVTFMKEMYFSNRIELTELPENYMSFDIPKEILDDSWIVCEQSFIANGDEKYILIGNLAPDNATLSEAFDKKWHRKHLKSYNPKRRIQYGFDDIEIIPFDTKICDEYESRMKGIAFDSIRHSFERLYIIEKVDHIVFPEIKDTIEVDIQKTPPILILDDLNFEVNQWKLSLEDNVKMKSIIEIMAEDPALKIKVLGYTDKPGTAEYNLKLSQKRAESVKNYLVLNGVSVHRIQAIGKGENESNVTRTNEMLSQKDRRVEIMFFR